MKSIAIKLSLFIISLCISLLISELILNFALSKYQLPNTYQPVDLVNFEKIHKLNNERYDDVYEHYQSIRSGFEIVTIGDSFTNGGNVNWNQTYPFYLFLNFNQSIPITNMGICEDTSRGTFLRLENYFEKKKTSTKTFIVVLVGAADFFYDGGLDFENIYSDIIKKGLVVTEEVRFKGEEELNYFSRTKIIKMFKFIFNYLSSNLKTLFSENIKESSTYSLLSPCYTGHDRTVCLKNTLRQLRESSDSKQIEYLIKDLISSIIYLNQKKAKPYNDYIEDLLTLYSEIPLVMTNRFFIFNLVSFTSMQSKYSLSNDILPIMKKSVEIDLSLHNSRKKDVLDNSVSIINAVEKWVSSKEKINQIQIENYRKIINLAKENNAAVIFLNYPLDYPGVNFNILKATSESHNAHFIDLNTLFRNKVKSGYTLQSLIGDWEHCTPLGYKLIADEVYKSIQDILEKN